MRRRVGSIVLAAALVMSQAAPSCCDDFWGCVAAVATLGISCKAQQIAEAIAGMKKLQAAVQKMRSDVAKSSDDIVKQAKDDTSSIGDGIKTKGQKSVDDIKTALNDLDAQTRKHTTALSHRGSASSSSVALAPGGAAAVGGGSQTAAFAGGSSAQGAGGASAQAGSASATAGGPGAGGSAMPFDPPADPARVSADLQRALEWVGNVHADASQKQLPALKASTEQAKKQVAQQEPPARQTVKDELLNPLDVINSSIEHIIAQIANPLDFSSVTSYINAQITQLQNKAPGTFDKEADQISSSAKDQLKDAQKSADRAQQGAQMSQKVADAAKKIVQSGKQSDLKKLEDIIGAPPNPMLIAPSASSSFLALSKTGGTAKASAANAKTHSASLAAQWGTTKQLLVFAPVSVTPAMHQRVEGDLTAMFRGKSVADARKTRDQLLAQAKVKFASDPKTLAAVQTYLQQKTAPFLASSPAQVRR